MFSFSHEDKLGTVRVKASNVSEQKRDVEHHSMWERRRRPHGQSSTPTILQVMIRMSFLTHLSL